MSDFDEWFTRYVRELRELGMHAYALESDLRNAFEAGKHAAVSARHA